MTSTATTPRSRETLLSLTRHSTPAWAAVLTWAVLLVIGKFAVTRMNVNPLTTHGVVVPLALGIPCGMVLFGLLARLRSTWLIGVAAGAYAAWAGTTIAAALVGTPFGYGIIAGDAGRMSALAMHFSTTWHPGDAADPSLAPEYPPLYPMIIGRVAAWTGRPAWTLLQPAQIVVTSFAVVASFLLWRRLVGDVAAFLASSSTFVAMVEPSKCNEILSLAVYLPWLLGTFAVTRRSTARVDPGVRPPRPLPPVVSGAIIGLIVPWSPQVLFLSVIGLLGMAGYHWWVSDAADRTRVLIRWGICVLVAFIVASWDVVPLALAYLSGKTQVVADLWLGSPLVTSTFTTITPGPLLFTLLEIVGLVGVAAQLRRVWWAPPIAIYLAGVLVERVLMLIHFSNSGHAFMLYYVGASLFYALNTAGILTLLQIWRWARPHLLARMVSVRMTGLVLASVLVCTSAWSAYAYWAPGPRGILDNVTNPLTPYNNAMYAHAQRLPSGDKVRYAAPNSPLTFASAPVSSFIRKALGSDHDPNVLSANQAIFAFNAWRDWLMPDRVAASGLTRWDYRHGLLAALTPTSDPATMANGLARLPFGAVDVLILKVTPAPAGSGGSATWKFADLAFQPSAFAGPQFTVSSPIGHYVAIVRVDPTSTNG